MAQAWMQYRKREDNYVFWQDKFQRNSTEIACARVNACHVAYEMWH
jgi:hypothetical protein